MVSGPVVGSGMQHLHALALVEGGQLDFFEEGAPPFPARFSASCLRAPSISRLPIKSGSSLFGVGCVRATGAMPAELDPLARRRCRPTGGVAPTSSFMVLVFL